LTFSAHARVESVALSGRQSKWRWPAHSLRYETPAAGGQSSKVGLMRVTAKFSFHMHRSSAHDYASGTAPLN
jgi:hypothetical protein